LSAIIAARLHDKLKSAVFGLIIQKPEPGRWYRILALADSPHAMRLPRQGVTVHRLQIAASRSDGPILTSPERARQ
jgi:hypothetical protein